LRFFLDRKELIQYAKKFISERINSLEKDVRHCLFQCGPDAPAPFPALLYCFATIDLLGALYFGNASKDAPTSEQSKKYMERFMGYTAEQAKLLQDLFRHKLVHLAQPKPILIDGSRHISWVYHHKNREKYLQLEALPKKEKILLLQNLSVECDHIFHVSIFHLVEDIKRSIRKPDGYFALLENSPDLQDKFEKAISQIYDYKVRL